VLLLGRLQRVKPREHLEDHYRWRPRELDSPICRDKSVRAFGTGLSR
jgi:hypothetical protein